MLKEVECFYFTEEWALDATITGSLQRKLICQTLICGCGYEFHYPCEENKRRKSISPIENLIIQKLGQLIDV